MYISVRYFYTDINMNCVSYMPHLQLYLTLTLNRELDLLAEVKKIKSAWDLYARKYLCRFDEVLSNGCKVILPTSCMLHWIWPRIVTLTCRQRSPKSNQLKSSSQVSIPASLLKFCQTVAEKSCPQAVCFICGHTLYLTLTLNCDLDLQAEVTKI